MRILDALAAGRTYAEIQAAERCSSATIAAIARRASEFERHTVAKLMSMKTLEALGAWEEAMRTGAKTGKHAPARDWLTHARVLEPVSSEPSVGAKVAVIIGMPGQPVGLPDAQVLIGQAITGTEDTQA